MASDVIIATLVGTDLCHAAGLTVQANAPALAMCRKLMEAGYDPKTPLHCFRGDQLAMTIKRIGWGAKYTVREDARVGPVLVKYKPSPYSAVKPKD